MLSCHRKNGAGDVTMPSLFSGRGRLPVLQLLNVAEELLICRFSVGFYGRSLQGEYYEQKHGCRQ